MDGGSALMTPHGEKEFKADPLTMQMMLDQMQKSFSKIKMSTV